MLGKSPNDVTEADLQALVDQGRGESRTLEFKEDYGRWEAGVSHMNDEQKKELLADVSSFANTNGGDIVFGIREKNGEASAVVGLEMADVDAEMLKLESILREGAEPRMPGIVIAPLTLTNGRKAVLIHVPRSWIAPHRVVKNNKFWGRNSKGKYEMDVQELRQAFAFSESVVERIRKFRDHRLDVISADEGLVPLKDGAKLVLHIIPLSAWTAPLELALDDRSGAIQPIGATGWNFRYALEGLGTYSGPEIIEGSVRAYSLLFRNGIIEAVDRIGHTSESGGGTGIRATAVEDALIHFLPHALRNLHERGVEGPFYVFMSLVGVRDHLLWRQGVGREQSPLVTIRKDRLVFPEITLPTTKVGDADVQLLCDMLFNAFGFPRSFSFDQNGKFIGSR